MPPAAGADERTVRLVTGPLPADEYRARAGARRVTLDARTREEYRISQMRLATFAVAVLVAVAVWQGRISGWWLVVPASTFVALIVRHERTTRAREAAARAVDFYERGLARLEDRWAGTGETGERFRDETHLYANDLDLFGRGSLFELLSVARTRAGEEILAQWLTQPGDAGEIAARQAAVTELTPQLDLREALSLTGSAVAAGVHTDHLVAWAEAPPRLRVGWRRWAAFVFTALTSAALVLWFRSDMYEPLLAAAIAQALFARPQLQAAVKVLHAASAPARDLSILLHVVRRLERERFTSPKLQALHQRIVAEGTQASTIIRRLEWLVEMHDWEHNIVFAPISMLLMWSMHIAWSIEVWRARHGHRIGTWLRAVGEIEALASLAAYRYEHPGDPFPVMLPASAGPAAAMYEGTGLGHPLLPASRMVVNDIALTATTRLLVISGSNMSGKSTLLRTVGINAVLAFAGAPVRARSLRLSLFAIGATLRIQDSLQEGRSRFYAEITRVAALVQVARGGRPLLFLLDELFHGTNSHDRLIGAEGVLRSLIDLGAAGLITTHDLALTALADTLSSHAANMHFEDHFEHGDIHFDYRMKPGPVTRSNALALMRAVGLDVEE